MAQDQRLYLSSRFDTSPSKAYVQRLAFLKASIYHRVMLAGAFVVARPPAPYIITTNEAEAVRYLLEGK